MKKIAFALIILVFAVGCAASPMLLRNEKGEIVKCEPSTGSVLIGGYIGSKISVKDCVKQYEKAGYKRIE